jgi:hypothetical protein
MNRIVVLYLLLIISVLFRVLLCGVVKAFSLYHTTQHLFTYIEYVPMFQNI